MSVFQGVSLGYNVARQDFVVGLHYALYVHFQSQLSRREEPYLLWLSVFFHDCFVGCYTNSLKYGNGMGESRWAGENELPPSSTVVLASSARYVAVRCVSARRLSKRIWHFLLRQNGDDTILVFLMSGSGL